MSINKVKVGNKVQLYSASFSHIIAHGKGEALPEIVDYMELYEVTESCIDTFYIQGYYYNYSDIRRLLTKETNPEYFL